MQLYPIIHDDPCINCFNNWLWSIIRCKVLNLQQSKMAENFFPVKKRQISLSLSERRQQKGARFVQATDSEVDAAAKGVVPKSTQHVNDWALKAFNDWIDARNTDAKDEDKVPKDLLSSSDPEIIEVCSGSAPADR